MPKRFILILLSCCMIVVAIAAGQVLALPVKTDAIEPLYARPYELSRCLKRIAPMDRKGGVVIQDEQTLQSRWIDAPGCKTEKSSSIDFSQSTLLGRGFVIPGGCSRGGNAFTLSVTQDPKRRVYTHTITHGIGPCAGQSTHEIWVLVPKLPTGYQVDFQEIRQRGLLITCGYEEE